MNEDKCCELCISYSLGMSRCGICNLLQKLVKSSDGSDCLHFVEERGAYIQ